MNLLVKMNRESKNVSIRIRVCSIIGSLIRHATVIENELSQLGIPEVMAELMKDKSEKVRRRAASALGEYLFYGATQMDEDVQNNSIWEISSNMVGFLLKTLKSSNEDDLVKFYICKTIENITAQSVNAGLKFANQEFALCFIALYGSVKVDAMKVCSIVCCGHLARLNNKLVPLIIEKVTLRHICQTFTEGAPRIQQVFISLLNFLIQNEGNKCYALLAEEKTLIPHLISLLDHSSLVIRGKCLLSFYLLFKTNLKWMMALSEPKFGPLLDRLNRDAYRYVQCCLIHLLDLVTELIPIILTHIEDELMDIHKA